MLFSPQSLELLAFANQFVFLINMLSLSKYMEWHLTVWFLLGKYIFLKWKTVKCEVNTEKQCTNKSIAGSIELLREFELHNVSLTTCKFQHSYCFAESRTNIAEKLWNVRNIRKTEELNTLLYKKHAWVQCASLLFFI